MQSVIKQAVILIGGLGTRLRPLTYQRPKALLPLLNRPLIAYEIELFARHGIRDLIMAISYQADEIKAALGDGSRWGVRLHYVEEKERLDTAGAIKNAADLIDGPFFACNGDIVYDVDLSAMARAHLDSGACLTLCLRRVEDVSAYGLIQCGEAGRVVAFREKVSRDKTGRNTVNSGFYAMDPRVLQYVPQGASYSNETQLFPGLLEAGEPVRGWLPPHEGYWSDVGRIETYLQTHTDLLRGAVSWVHPAVACAVVDPTVRIVEPVDIADGVTIGPNCRIGPDVAIGTGCAIGEDAVVNESIIWPSSRIGRGADLSGVIVASGAVVADGARHADEVIMPQDA